MITPEAVTEVLPNEAALVDYPEYKRKKALAEAPPPTDGNVDRILYVPPDWAGLVDRTQYDRVELIPEEQIP